MDVALREAAPAEGAHVEPWRRLGRSRGGWVAAGANRSRPRRTGAGFARPARTGRGIAAVAESGRPGVGRTAPVRAGRGVAAGSSGRGSGSRRAGGGSGGSIERGAGVGACPSWMRPVGRRVVGRCRVVRASTGSWFRQLSGVLARRRPEAKRGERRRPPRCLARSAVSAERRGCGLRPGSPVRSAAPKRSVGAAAGDGGVQRKTPVSRAGPGAADESRRGMSADQAIGHSKGAPHTGRPLCHVCCLAGDLRIIQLELDIMSAPRQVKSGSAAY